MLCKVSNDYWASPICCDIFIEEQCCRFTKKFFTVAISSGDKRADLKRFINYDDAKTFASRLAALLNEGEEKCL